MGEMEAVFQVLYITNREWFGMKIHDASTEFGDRMRDTLSRGFCRVWGAARLAGLIR
jgi:hypothetical protein